jgi:diacylglycerol kinase family enzyme
VQVTLIHNPGAGSGALEPAALERTIRRAGHRVRARSCRDDGWQAVLEEPADLVAVVGGDGTIGHVARRMVGRGIPIAALAAGTANNIAMTLGTEHLSPEAQIDGWRDGRPLGFDVAVARGPWGCEYLLEGLGCGLFVWAMQTADADDDQRKLPANERLPRVLAMLNERVAAHPTVNIQAQLDDRDLSGDYVLLEAMNTRFIGPNLFLAPSGHSGDGQLDVVVVSNDARASFREQLASWRRGALRPPDWPSQKGRRLTLWWSGFPLHLDDRVWPDAPTAEPEQAVRIDVEVEQGALTFLVPPETEHPAVE